MQDLSSEAWKAALQVEQRAIKDKVASVVQAGFTAFGAQCDLLSQRPKGDAAAMCELMTPVLVEKVRMQVHGMQMLEGAGWFGQGGCTRLWVCCTHALEVCRCSACLPIASATDLLTV